jgi:hypothetical protein
MLQHPLLFHRDLIIFFAIFLSPLPRYSLGVGAGAGAPLLLPSSSHNVVESGIEKKEKNRGKKKKKKIRKKKESTRQHD